MVELSYLGNLLRYNLKITARKNYIIALVLMIMLPFVVGFRLIDEMSIMRIYEVYISLFGIIILGIIMQTDDDCIDDVIRSKKMSIIVTFLSKVFIASASIIICCTVVCMMGVIGGGDFREVMVIYGGAITAITLGIVCVTVHNLTKSAMTAYMVATEYYVMEYMTRGKYTGSFFLMGMLGGDISGKTNLLILDFVLIMVNIVLVTKK